MEKTINIEELTQDQHNFNKGTDEGAELMERSFKELGAGRSVLVDKNGHIIAGNKSQKAAMAAGIKKVRVIETDGTELVAVKRTDIEIDSAEGRRLAFLDNLTTQVNLSWDETELQQVEADVPGFDVADFGVSIDQMPTVDFEGRSNRPQTPVEHKEVKEDDFDPDAKFETKVHEGEIWKLGAHRLLCGDSTKAEDVFTLMGDEKADLWLTDPPYNVSYEGGTNDKLTIKNDSMEDGKFRQFLLDAFTAAVAVMKPGAAFYIWHADSEGFNFRYAVKESGLLLKQCLIWNKNQLVMGRQDYQWKHEPCLYGWKDGAAHNWFSDRKQTTVINWDKPLRNGEHPTMKPVGLFGYQIQNSSKECEIILDTFGGSGTTIVACEQLNRKARCIELDPHYCNVIIARLEKLTGQKAVKI